MMFDAAMNVQPILQQRELALAENSASWPLTTSTALVTVMVLNDNDNNNNLRMMIH